MKPCRRNRKAITWLAIDALDPEAERLLRNHLKTCEGCRHAYEEVSRVAHTLVQAVPQEDLLSTEGLHQRVRRGLRTLGRQPKPVGRIPFLRELTTGRLATAALVVLAMGIILAAWLRHPGTASRVTRFSQTGSGSSPLSAAPTLAHYRAVANASLDQFDDLLMRQARQNLPPAPLYRVAQTGTVD